MFQIQIMYKNVLFMCELGVQYKEIDTPTQINKHRYNNIIILWQAELLAVYNYICVICDVVNYRALFQILYVMQI